MDIKLLVQWILSGVCVVCFVGWLIASYLERDLFAGKWRGSLMGGWLVSGLAGIVIALIRYGGMM